MLNQILTKLISTVLSGSDISAADIISETDVPLVSMPDFAIISASDGVTPIKNSGGGAGTLVIIILVLLLFLAAMIAMEAARSKYVLSVNRQNITLPDLPKAFDGVKIALIGDLHQMEFGEYNTLLARRIKLEEPDYIFFAGDMGDSNSYSVDAFYDLLEALGSDIPLIIVPGNHDLRLGGGKVHKNVVDEIVSNGALLLDNTCAQIALGNEKIYVYGFCPELEKKENVDIKQWGFERVSEGYIRKRLGDCPKDAPVVLLTHDPAPFSAYAKWGASLVLAGHVHGGTVRLPLIGGLFSPSKTLKPKYSAGEYKLQHSTMFVTRGLGSDSFARFGNPPEISVLTITRKPMDEERRALMSGSENMLGISDEVVETTKQRNKDAATSAENPFKELAAAIKRGWQWTVSESKSIKDLLHERSDDLRDTIDDKRGVEKNRYAKEADRRKKASTYLSPASRAKENAKRVRDGGGRAVTDTPAEHQMRVRKQQAQEEQKRRQEKQNQLRQQQLNAQAAQQRQKAAQMTDQQRRQMYQRERTEQILAEQEINMRRQAAKQNQQRSGQQRPNPQNRPNQQGKR